MLYFQILSIRFKFCNLKSFFDTVQEFLKLEKIEIGGLKGRTLSGRIVKISQEFHEHFSVFATKTYNVLDPEDDAFIFDYNEFQVKIMELDRKLASILCEVSKKLSVN